MALQLKQHTFVEQGPSVSLGPIMSLCQPPEWQIQVTVGVGKEWILSVKSNDLNWVPQLCNTSVFWGAEP